MHSDGGGDGIDQAVAGAITADQLRSHLALARDNGVTEGEIAETITHLAFYAGWPSAVTAVGVARDVFGKKPEKP